MLTAGKVRTATPELENVPSGVLKDGVPGMSDAHPYAHFQVRMCRAFSKQAGNTMQIDFQNNISMHRLQACIFDIADFRCGNPNYEKHLKNETFEEQDASISHTSELGNVRVDRRQTYPEIRPRERRTGTFSSSDMGVCPEGSLCSNLA